MTLLQIYHWVCQWKNFENRSTFGELTDKSIVACFFDSQCSVFFIYCIKFKSEQHEIREIDSLLDLCCQSLLTVNIISHCTRVARGSDGPAGRVWSGQKMYKYEWIGSGRVQFDLMTKIYCKILRCWTYYTYNNVLNIFNVVVYVFGDVTNPQQIV